MKSQRVNAKKINRFLNFIKNDFINILKDIKHNLGMLLNGKYNPINPYRINIISRLFIKSIRKRNLFKSYKNAVQKINLKNEYVYFPLHYEPEKTTNPDGGFFHDQFLALVYLRKFIPDSMDIVIKEHPSQFFSNMHGSKGRSPLFYSLIKNIKNVMMLIQLT